MTHIIAQVASLFEKKLHIRRYCTSSVRGLCFF